MNNRYSTAARSIRVFLVASLGAVFLTACNEPGNDEGIVINATALPNDTFLDLSCADAGIFAETCVLDDPDNPFAETIIVEFDVNNEEAFNKFDLANGIESGPSGAKARFYFWATALARRPSGENQWYTARALHELWSAARDPIIKEQALRAYRSVLDNFFGSATFFEFCPTCPAVPITLNEQVAKDLYDGVPGFARIAGDELDARSLLGEWGYTYDPETETLSVNEG